MESNQSVKPLTNTSKFDVFGPKSQCQTDRKFTRLLAVLVTNHFAGSWHRLSAAEPSKDPSAAAYSGQLGIPCKVLVGAKSAANSHYGLRLAGRRTSPRSPTLVPSRPAKQQRSSRPPRRHLLISTRKLRRKRPMASLKMKSCAVLLTLLAGCASREVVAPVVGACPVPPAPPAWAMQEPSNSLQLLDRLFSISALGSLPTKQP